MTFRIASAFLTILALAVTTLAGNALPQPEPALIQRADKIVAKLGLTDTTQAESIRLLIAQQYAALRPIHEQRDRALKLANEMPNKAAKEAKRAEALTTATARLAELQYAFIARLSAELTPEQVEGVKDGMTFGVMPLTFGVYQKMLPNLTTEQKIQIRAWLLEAREHAMTASTSEEKHNWFGKYKGRINNYLSAAGYNLKEAEKNLKK